MLVRARSLVCSLGPPRSIMYMTVFAFHARISTVDLRANEEHGREKKKTTNHPYHWNMFALNFACADHNLLLYELWHILFMARSHYVNFKSELRYFRASMKRPTYGNERNEEAKKKNCKKMWRAMTTTICMQTNRNETETSKKTEIKISSFKKLRPLLGCLTIRIQILITYFSGLLSTPE